jgi:hypothetical protein
MSRRPLLIPVLLCLACFLAVAAGCTQHAAQPPATATTAVTPEEEGPPLEQTLLPKSCSLVPGPTQAVPDYESVSVTVDRNTVSENPTITTRFNGGKGLGMVESMTVTVIRSDCVQEQQVRKNPPMGTSMVLMGTTATDRVIATLVMTSGETYTVIDQDYPFAPQI